MVMAVGRAARRMPCDTLELVPARVQSSIATFPDEQWAGPASSSSAAAAALESGDVLFFPSLAFAVAQAEMELFSPDLVAAAKNVSFDPRTGRLGGTSLADADAERLRALIARFSASASALVDRVLPAHRGRIEIARASFRP